jgi:hypothetical protein
VKPRKKFSESVDEFERNAIRRKVHDFFFGHELPTIDKVLAAVNEDKVLGTYRRTTFYNLLKELHSKYVRRGRDSMLTDRDNIIFSVISSKQAFLSGLTTRSKAPSGKGRRLIITHIGSQKGFVDGCLRIFEFKKTGNYHEEMCAESFENWFRAVLPRLEDNAVIVIDNAPYHSRKKERIPTTNWNIQKVENEMWKFYIIIKESEERLVIDHNEDSDSSSE